MTEATEARAFEAVSRHARFADLVAMTRSIAVRAAAARALEWKPLGESLPAATPGAPSLREEDAATDFGNAWSALERGPRTADEHALLRALWAHAIAETRTASPEEEDALVAQVVWLAAFTPFDATLLLDRALGDGDAAPPFWHGLAERLRRIDAGEIAGAGRPEAIAAAVGLRSSSSPAAARELARLAPHLIDPAVAQLLSPAHALAPSAPPGADPSPELHGELVAPPRSLALTILLAVTGVLFVSAVVRLVARVALAYRRPADVTLTATSVRVRWKTLVLGRTIRDHDVLLARQGLARAVREVRYPRVAFYAGLLSMALGSLLGVRTFVDGMRSASPSLLFYGLSIVAVGVALDFLLAAVGSGLEGKCRVIFVERDGTALSVRNVDAVLADRALGQLTNTAK